MGVCLEWECEVISRCLDEGKTEMSIIIMVLLHQWLFVTSGHKQIESVTRAEMMLLAKIMADILLCSYDCV